jgi:hypothetical protein
MGFIAEVSATDRFWSKVDKSAGHGPNGDCWVWTARRNLDGYGQFRPSSWRSGGKLVSAHVFSYRESFGEFDAGLQVLHRCDNPACVRAEHLFVGTQVDNVHDMIAKNRSGLNFLGSDVIANILAMHGKGIKQTEIAKNVGIHKQSVWRIIKRMAVKSLA